MQLARSLYENTTHRGMKRGKEKEDIKLSHVGPKREALWSEHSNPDRATPREAEANTSPAHHIIGPFHGYTDQRLRSAPGGEEAGAKEPPPNSKGLQAVKHSHQRF